MRLFLCTIHRWPSFNIDHRWTYTLDGYTRSNRYHNARIQVIIICFLIWQAITCLLEAILALELWALDNCIGSLRTMWWTEYLFEIKAADCFQSLYISAICACALMGQAKSMRFLRLALCEVKPFYNIFTKFVRPHWQGPPHFKLLD